MELNLETVSRHDNEYTICNLCNKRLKCSKDGFQTIFSHSEKIKHKSMSNARYNTHQAHIIVSSKPTSSKSTSQPSESSTASPFQLDPIMGVKVRAAEAKWLFKLVQFSRIRSKAPIIFRMGLVHYCLSNCVIRSSDAKFNLLYDETTTQQRIKQIDVLAR